MTPASGGSRRVPDIRYGEVPGYRPLELDLYLPGTGGPAPVIVHVHGGGWRRGSRREPLRALGEDFYDTLAAQGFAVAAVDYRLSAEAWFPRGAAARGARGCRAEARQRGEHADPCRRRGPANPADARDRGRYGPAR